MEVGHDLPRHYVPSFLHGCLHTSTFNPERVGGSKDSVSHCPPFLSSSLLRVPSLDQKQSLLLLCLTRQKLAQDYFLLPKVLFIFPTFQGIIPTERGCRTMGFQVEGKRNEKHVYLIF